MYSLFILKLIKPIISLPLIRNYFFEFYKKFIKNRPSLDNAATISKTNGGLTLKLSVKDWIQANLFFLGKYEYSEMLVLAKLLKKDDTFIDLGANIGLYSLTASKIVGLSGQVISFEPFAKNYNRLIENLKLNSQFTANVMPVKKAVGNSDKDLILYSNEDDSNLGMVSTKEREHTHKEVVKSVTLDSYIENGNTQKVSLIKIDIEGHEKEALKGMEKTILKFKPSFIIEILEGESKDYFNEFFKSRDYKMYFINDTGELSETNINKRRHNYVFVHEE